MKDVSIQGVLQMRTTALFDTKNFGFFEIYGVSTQTGGVKPVRTFCGQGGGGQFFVILCGRPLWTAPYGIQLQKNFFRV